MTARLRSWVLAALAASAAIVLVAAPASAASTDDASKATSLKLTVTNTTGGYLALQSAVNSHGHWQDRPDASLAPGASTDASSYDSGVNGSKITLAWVTADGVTITVEATVPFDSPNSGSASVSSGTLYGADVNVGSGWHSDSSATIFEGRQTYAYTGGAQTFTVPDGATSVDFIAIGAEGNTSWGGIGGQLSGNYPATGGEQFTVGVGQGGAPGTNAWGLPTGSGDCYCGGSGENYSGGAATAILDGSGDLVTVAGGGGGGGAVQFPDNGNYYGGSAGEPLGGNDGDSGDFASGGGAGSQSTAAGENASGGNNGGGGGGYRGGGAGSGDGSGGSGSSYFSPSATNTSNAVAVPSTTLDGSAVMTPRWTSAGLGEPRISVVTFAPGTGEPAFQLAAFPGHAVGAPDDPVRDGYAFAGWFTDAGERWDFASAPEGDLVLTARWTPLPASVTTSGDAQRSGTELAATGLEVAPAVPAGAAALVLAGVTLVLAARVRRLRPRRR